MLFISTISTYQRENIDHRMSEDIKGKILFFSPNEEEASYFTDSLIYICDHNESGSLGLIFNRPLNLELKDLFKGMKFKEISNVIGNVFLGGPVNPGAIFILHSPDKSWKGTVKASEEIYMSTDYEAIEDIAHGDAPNDFIITLGYTGWAPGQLQEEISENAWISFEADKDLIFKISPEDQINEISRIVGYDIRMISPDFGNA